ncbi:hypothetical protein [Actinoplanes xinjiangensis]|uniref:hypothetical protein n=1 Tax=Actinoplanes xinjiangensis TaxID=512350 RepID=UPI00341A8E0F
MANPRKRSRIHPYRSSAESRRNPVSAPRKAHGDPAAADTPGAAAAAPGEQLTAEQLTAEPPAAGLPAQTGRDATASAAEAGPTGDRAEPKITTRELLAIGSALLLLLFLIKIYGVGRYSLTTTTALLAATPVQVALGTVTIYAYYVLPAIALGTLWFAIRFRARLQPALWPLILIVATVTALASPYKYLLNGLTVVAVALCVELVVLRLRRRWADSPDERLSRRHRTLGSWQGLSVVYLGAAALAFQFMHSLDAPWVSAQAFLLNGSAVTATQNLQDGVNRLEVRPASRFVGYPIAETEEWLTVLHADTRYVMRIPQSAVDTRLTCHNENDQLAGDQPLLEALKGNTYSSPNLDCREVLRYLERKSPGGPLPTWN